MTMTAEQYIALIKAETEAGNNTKERIGEALETVLGRTVPERIEPPVPLTGLVSTGVDSLTVVGNGTLFTTELVSGDVILINGAEAIVETIYEDEELELRYNFNGAFSDVPYAKSNVPNEIESGKIVIYKGTAWRGLSDGESCFPENTAWPIAGYKELIMEYITNSLGELVSTNTIKNDFFRSERLNLANPSDGASSMHLTMPELLVPVGSYLTFGHHIQYGSVTLGVIPFPYLTTLQINDITRLFTGAAFGFGFDTKIAVTDAKIIIWMRQHFAPI